MPEELVRVLRCDYRDGREGRRFIIDETGEEKREVILCAEHAAPLEEIAGLGRKVPRSRPRPSRGLSEDRLEQLIVPNEEANGEEG